ncbi:pyruvate dehydrogenase complex dihydrolipoamide acetyltransferase [Halteromyces radiatus]|uniref:pyruvate dehydrogenase complex dihydrolipoamide acetyltransferase n=1 Tax=Halteromyces radiatus TaxID=101107 RepID=UPI002220C856|nr:pyruvate dehydrogenase complex dihydrolipoamide acetyltransferase [Halteromyces radiatus]KAI8099728.1 pyruvate dehydrogenase complex dihydrolipoamide acetyltransferase [Halteromyces radiatus]
MSSARRQLFRLSGTLSSARVMATRATARAAPLLANQARQFSSLPMANMTALRAVATPMMKDIRFYSSKSFPEHNIIAMPALSPTMTQGGIGAWQKAVGDEVQPGDVLVEIETDKAQMDFECQEEGFLAKILVETGAKDFPVGKPIAVLVEDKDDVAAFENFTVDDIESAGAATPAPATPAKEEAPKEEAAAPVQQETSAPSGGNVKASPYAKKTASERGLDISQVQGTGPSGRVVKDDVDNFKAAQPAAAVTAAATPVAAPPAPAYAPQSATGEAYTDIPASSMRKIIASRLTESKQQLPHYYLTVEINMDKINKLRQVLNTSAEGKYKLSVNDFVVKAAALSLKKVPEANAAWQGDFIRQYNTSDVCVAVATPTGLITPIIGNAETKGLADISSQVRDLATRARAGKLAPQEYQGGSFTISNLGMYGIKNFTAIINQPQACILAVGGSQQKVVVDETSESGFGVRDVMEVTLSCDHRVVDGAVGATWLQAFREYMEQPLKMML